LGGAGCRAFIEAAKPEHPSLIDQHHVLADLFGVINIPSSVWIDERGMIVRPAEPAPAPPRQNAPPRFNLPSDLPQHFVEMFTEASKIKADPESYHAALRDWVDNGAASRFALSPDEVLQRSRPRDADKALGHAHFALATQLEIEGRHDDAIRHFREAHRRTGKLDVPPLPVARKVGDGPLARFWQGQAG
jgi:hypothetical protein